MPIPNLIFDSHCHLNMVMERAGISLQEIIDHCKQNQVGQLMTVCTSLEDIAQLKQIVQQQSGFV